MAHKVSPLPERPRSEIPTPQSRMTQPVIVVPNARDAVENPETPAAPDETSTPTDESTSETADEANFEANPTPPYYAPGTSPADIAAAAEPPAEE